MGHLSCRSCGRVVILGENPPGEWCECASPQLAKGGPGRGLPSGASPGVVNNLGVGPVSPVRVAMVGRGAPTAAQMAEARSGVYRPSEWDRSPEEAPPVEVGQATPESLPSVPPSSHHLLEEPEEGPF